jgi:transcriptional regulator GlxA family with amidase domain
MAVAILEPLDSEVSLTPVGGWSARVRALIAAEPGRWTLATAARALMVAPRSLQRYLANENTSFHAELQGARVCSARTLLRDTDWKLAAVAREVGFASAQHFNQVFRRYEGDPPRVFREKLRGSL